MTTIVWKSLPTVLTVDELLDKAFSRASKTTQQIDDRDKLRRTRKQMLRMVQAAGDVLSATLIKWVERWPSLDQLSHFDHALVDAAVGCDDYRHSLGTLHWAAKKVNEIGQQNQIKIRRTRRIELMHDARREAYGRISSIVGQIEPALDWLSEARDTLRYLPSIDPNEACIVVSGAPNVGKSALIAAISSGTPEVAAYPFTTRQLHVGHFEHRRRVYQLVDTPGLLDRPMETRNPVEMQAVAALEHIGSLVLFLLDPSDNATTPLNEQQHLLSEVADLLPQTPLFVVDGKADLLGLEDEENSNPASGHLAISPTTGRGMEELRTELINRIAFPEDAERLSLPEDWPRRDK